MNILWFTTRNRADLCATTLDALGKGLSSKGHQVTIINSDAKGAHANLPWRHIPISVKAIRGRKARVLGLEMRKWLLQSDIENNTVAIVDWRIAKTLHRSLEDKNLPWVLMDRSPPADRGLLARLQWPVWKRAWRFVKNRNASAGCVVSKPHLEFVHSQIGVNKNIIAVIPAGVDLSLFNPKKRNEILTLVYQGRLDHHRGVLSLPIFQQKLTQEGISSNLILVGEGNAKPGLERMANGRENMQVIGKIPPEKLAEVLGKAHVGLLPMPKTRVWSLASPLKRSEYAASGLIIFGIDHNGHRFEQSPQPAWLHLVNQEDFHQDGVKWIRLITPEKMKKLSIGARAYAEEHLDWEKSVNSLEKVCLDSIQMINID